MQSKLPNKRLLCWSVILSLLLSYIPSLQAQGLRNLFFNSTQNVVRLDFATTPPTPWLTGLQGSGFAEGLAHFEDADGNVVFWFNDVGVYDQNGNLMPGSIGIYANNSSAEMSMAVKPDDPCKFYIFYNVAECTSLHYSIVDLSLNGGLGDVTDLNTLLMPGYFSEGFEVIRIPNACAYWLLVYQCNVGFRRFLVDPAGIQDQGIAHSYPSPGGFDGRGELDYHNGRLGMAFASSNHVFAANFDPFTGLITNPINLNNSSFENKPYGLEFSPDASNMYFSLWYTSATIFQYNFATAEITEYNPSTGGSMSGFGEIELGRDGKLYIIQNGGNHITVMDNANTIPTFSNITVDSNLGLGISDPIQSDIFSYDIYDTDTICQIAGNLVTLFSQDDLYEYEWRAGNNPTGSVIHEGSNFQFTMSENDTIFLADAVAVSSGCILTATGCGQKRFVVLNSPTLQVGSDTIIDPGQSYTIPAISSNNDSSTYAWVALPTGVIDNPFILQPTVSPTETTTYYGSVQKGPCQSSDFMTIYVREAQYDTVCAKIGESYTLQIPPELTDITWIATIAPGIVLSTNATFSPTLTTPTITFRGKGTNANADGGLVYSVTLIAEPELDAGPNQAIFLGGSAILNATGGGSSGYEWATDTTLSSLNIPNPVASPEITSWYYVSSSNDAVCTATDSVRIAVIRTIEDTDSLCTTLGQAITLTLPVDTFQSQNWYDMADKANSLGTGTSISVTLQGNFYSTYVAKCLANSGDTVIYYTTLMLNPDISASAGIILEGFGGVLTATGGSNYTWSPADLLDDPQSATPHVVPTLADDTTFTVINTTDDGCKDSTSIDISVFSESTILVPSSFSPNNDGMNDVLNIVSFNVVQLREFKIFNRWGQKIFETNNITDGWDGQFQNSDQEIGTYVYFLSAVDKEGQIVEKKGNVTLLR